MSGTCSEFTVVDDTKSVLPLRLDFVEHLGDKFEDILNVTRELFVDTMSITCAVYLRTECLSCMVMRGLPRYFDWINEKAADIIMKDNDVPQYMRQCVIWTKEFAEEQMQQPCTRDMITDEVH